MLGEWGGGSVRVKGEMTSVSFNFFCFFCRFRSTSSIVIGRSCRLIHQRSRMKSAMRATPPTTPPAIAPTGSGDFSVEVESDEPVERAAVRERTVPDIVEVLKRH